MKLRLSLRMVMAIVAGCALILAAARSSWWNEWLGWLEYLFVALLTGLIVGTLGSQLSLSLLSFVGRRAPWRHQLGRDPDTEPRLQVWHRVSRWAVRFYSRWPTPLKEAFWSGCAALLLVFVLDQLSAGSWWSEGAPGEIGWRAYALLSAAVIFVACAGWPRLAPSWAKVDLARAARKWLHGPEMTELSTAIRSGLSWLLITSPGPFRIILAWMLAEVSVPFDHLIATVFFHVGPDTNAYVIVPVFLAVLVVWLLGCLAILVRALDDMSRVFFPPPVAIVSAVTLSAVHAWAFFGVARWL
jgi:hypothetical protein